MEHLRALLVQRAARLQDRPALTAPEWGTLSWSAWRNRVEGVGFALMAQAPIPASVHSATGTPWDWACEVAAACCGIPWESSAPQIDSAILGGAGFHPESGRGPYHDREQRLSGSTPFSGALDHSRILLRLQRLNSKLGWDHRTELQLSLSNLGQPGVRAALWSLLYAGGHAGMASDPASRWDPAPFEGFWSP